MGRDASSDRMALERAQGPANLLFWAGPHNSPSKLRFWSPFEEKSGVLTFIKDGTDEILVRTRGRLLLTRHNLWGAAIYSRQLYVSFIQRRDVDLTASIAPWICEREGFFLSPSCYIKRLRGSFFLFYLHIRTESSRELQRPEILEHLRSSNLYNRFCEAPFLKEIFDHLTGHLWRYP